MSRNKGTFDFSNSFEPRVRQPLDSKQLVSVKEDLTGSTTWLSNTGDEWTFVGMLVSVQSGVGAGVYRLTASDYTQISNWEQLGANPDLSAYYTSGQTDTLLLGKTDTGTTTELSTSLSSEISSRISGDSVLSTAISGETSSRISADAGLSTSLSSEISSRISGDTFLQSEIDILSGVTIWTDIDLNTILSSGQALIKTGSTLTGYTISNFAQNSELSSEISSRISGDLVLSSAISVISGQTVDLSGYYTSGQTNALISSVITGYTSADTSLSSAIIQPWIDIDRCGFVDNSVLSLSFDDSTLVFTLSGLSSSWSYYRTGIKHTISGDKQVTIPNLTNTYYIYINSTDGTLLSGTTAWTLQDASLPVAILQYNPLLTPKYHLAYELHTSKIDRREHLYLHSTRGSQYVNGGELTGPDVMLPNASNTNATSCFGVSATTIADEDLFLNLSGLTRPDGSTTTGYTCFYRTGSTTWSWNTSVVPFTYGANNRIMYDNGSGVMTEAPATNNRWYNWYLIYTDFQGQSRFGLFPGRGLFTSLALAQAEDVRSFDFTGFPIVESVIAYQFSWQYDNAINNLGKVKLGATPRKVNVSTITSTGSSGSADHNNLAGLQGGTTAEFYHLTNADYIVVTGISSALSTEISTRASADVVLSTSIAGFGTMATYTFWSGTTAAYTAVNPKLSTTLYFITP